MAGNFAESDEPEEDDVGFLFDEVKAEEILDLEPVDFLGPVPAEAFERLDHRKAGGLDPALDGAILAPRGFAFDELAEVVEVSASFASGLGRERLAMFFDEAQMKVIEMSVEKERYRERLSWQLFWVVFGFVKTEIGGAEFDFEQVGAPDEVKRAGLGSQALTLFEDVGDVFAGEGLEVEGVFKGAHDLVPPIDVGECDDLVDVSAGI
jgi:hypothetical protein